MEVNHLTEKTLPVSYARWILSRWHGIPIWLIFALALAYNIFTGVTFVGVLTYSLFGLKVSDHKIRQSRIIYKD